MKISSNTIQSLLNNDINLYLIDLFMSVLSKVTCDFYMRVKERYALCLKGLLPNRTVRRELERGRLNVFLTDEEEIADNTEDKILGRKQNKTKKKKRIELDSEYYHERIIFLS